LSDELSESGVEAGSDRWVDASVGFPEDGFAVSVVFDRPSVFMQEPVVVTTEEDQIVQIGGSSIGPMLLVVGVEPSLERTSRPPTASVPMPELVT
jgi:hypothetical protein